MLSIEKKLIEWVEKNRYILATILVTVFALYLRKIGIWWNEPNVTASFDMHEGYTQSSLYYVLIRLVQYLPLLPLHSVKWMAGLCDFVVAILCAYLCGGKNGLKEGKSAIIYIVLLFSPVCFIRGVIWGQIDSVAMVLLLAALVAWEKRKLAISVLFAIVACSLYPGLFLAVVWFLQSRKVEKRELFIVGIGGVGLILLGVCSVILGNGFADGVLSFVRWTTYHPVSAVVYDNAVEWMQQMISYMGYSVCILTAVAALRKKLKIQWTVVCHLLVTIVYGSQIFLTPLY